MNIINSKDMKKILAIAFAAMMSLGTMAQTAQQVLDKTAAVIGNKKGRYRQLQDVKSEIRFG